MKKFIAGVVVGGLISETIGAYQLGYFRRGSAYIRWLFEVEEVPPVTFSDIYTYITTGKSSPEMFTHPVNN